MWGFVDLYVLTFIHYESRWAFVTEGATVKRVGPLAPNLNGVIERFFQSVRRECLDQFVVCGEGHLQHLFKEYLEHHNSERPHQAKGNLPLSDADGDEHAVVPFPSGEIECHTRRGGLLRHSYRAAA